MTTVSSRTTLRTKAELKAWLASHNIEVAAPLKQERGSLLFVPVLPPRVPGMSVVQKSSIGARGLTSDGEGEGYQHEGTKYVPGPGFVALTPDELVQADQYIARLREIDALVQAELRNVYIKLR